MRLVVSVAMLLLAGTSLHAQTADQIWGGGPILTMNDADMRAEAVAVAGGRIMAVDSRADVMKHEGPDTQLMALGGLQAMSANLLAPPDGVVRGIVTTKMG